MNANNTKKKEKSPAQNLCSLLSALCSLLFVFYVIAIAE
jgi:hypothetical protein